MIRTIRRNAAGILGLVDLIHPAAPLEPGLVAGEEEGVTAIGGKFLPLADEERRAGREPVAVRRRRWQRHRTAERFRPVVAERMAAAHVSEHQRRRIVALAAFFIFFIKLK